MEGIPVGHPLFQSGEEERVPSCHCAFWLRPNEQDSTLVTLSDVSCLVCMLAHISVTDVISIPLATVTGRSGLCGSGRPIKGQEIPRSDYL